MVVWPPWTTQACQSLYMEFSRQNTGVGKHSLLPRGSSQPRIKPRSPALQVDSWPSEPPHSVQKHQGTNSILTLSARVHQQNLGKLLHVTGFNLFFFNSVLTLVNSYSWLLVFNLSLPFPQFKLCIMKILSPENFMTSWQKYLYMYYM